MKKSNFLIYLSLIAFIAKSQNSPVITSWLQDTVTTGSYYVANNSTALNNNILVNCQKVEYNTTSVYVTATGVPSYTTGPFLDGNPSNATNQSAIFQIPLAPVANTGTPTATSGGNIGIFINGVALFDYRDGVRWDPINNRLCGGPGNPMCPGGGPMSTGDWNRDAIPAEMAGFDCAKGHPAMGNYHHHQNPSAFNLDLSVLSTICNLYNANGLYAIDSTKHSPLIGFAYDGFPIYGAYGYRDTNGTGGIVRIKSGYSPRNITTRTTHAGGGTVTSGPAVSTTYPIGYFREDYEFIANSAPDYLDEHNGRFCVTPEYPNGTYAYFATVDNNWNSAYPYAVGPTFYGVYANRKVTTVPGGTTRYIQTTTGISDADFKNIDVSIFPNPASDLIAIQLGGLVTKDITVDLLDISGKLVNSSTIYAGSTIAHFDVQTVYEGTYIIRFSSNGNAFTRKVVILKE